MPCIFSFTLRYPTEVIDQDKFFRCVLNNVDKALLKKVLIKLFLKESGQTTFPIVLDM